MTYNPRHRRSPVRADAEVVLAAWPVDGPYSAQLTTEAARTLAGLVRYLTYATRSAVGLPDPVTVYDVLGPLAETVGGLAQALRQMAARLVELAADPAAAVDNLGMPITAQDAAEGARVALTELACPELAEAASRIGQAHGLPGRLYLDGDAG